MYPVLDDRFGTDIFIVIFDKPIYRLFNYFVKEEKRICVYSIRLLESVIDTDIDSYCAYIKSTVIDFERQVTTLG